MTTPKLALAYCRVSAKSQTDRGTGLRSQERTAQDYAQSLRVPIERVFKDAKSGGVAHRPGMDQLIAHLRKHPPGTYYVIIAHIDRFAKDVPSHWKLRVEIEEAGGVLVSPSMEFGKSSSARLMENIHASAAQYQRDHNREQTLSRMLSRAKDGYWPFAIPVGFQYVKARGNGKIAVPLEPVASIVREGLEGFASNRFVTQADLARFFRSQPEFPRDRRGQVQIQVVEDILKRPFYAGFIHNEAWELNMIPAKHPALISYATYKAIQDKLEGKYRPRPRLVEDDPFVLRGSVVCTCGTPLTACFSKSSSGKRYGYYLCPDKSRTCPEYGKSIPMAKLEAEFEALVKSLTPAPSLLALAKEAVLFHWEKHTASATRRVTAAKQELSKVDRDIDQLLERIVETESVTVITAYERKIKSLEDRRAELRGQLNSQIENKPDFERVVRTVFEFFSNPWNLWVSGVSADRKILLKLAFPKRLIYSRNHPLRTQEPSLFQRLASSDALKTGMARPERFERPTLRFVVPKGTSEAPRRFHAFVR